MSKWSEIGQYVTKKIQCIQETEDYAALAKLRRGMGHQPGEVPELYGILLENMPEVFWNNQGEVTEEEWSCYVALTLFAWHQQGNDLIKECVHTEQKYESIGKTMKKLSYALNREDKDPDAEKRMQRRLQMLMTSKDMPELFYHLKSMVTLIRKEKIAINYSELAQDIYLFQFQDTRPQVSLKWAQDFYRINKEEEDNEDK